MRVDRRAVEATPAVATTAEGAHWSSCQGPPDHPQRHPVGAPRGQSVALLARPLRFLEDGRIPVLSLDASRHLGPGLGCVAAAGRRRGTAELEPAFCR